MQIPSVSSTDAATAAASATSGATATSGTPALGRDAFLRLLVAQLRHQDPLSPQDPTAFVGQLAQLTQVEEASRSRQQLEQMTSGMLALANAGTTDLVGRTVTARADSVVLGVAGSSNVGFTLGENAAAVRITVRDATGAVVRTIDAGPRNAGSVGVEWDGLDDAGQRLPPGSYRASVEATDASGGAITAETEMRGRVTAIDFSRGYAELVLDGDVRVAAGDVLRVEDAGSRTATSGDATEEAAGAASAAEQP